MTSRAENRAGWGPGVSKKREFKSNPRTVNNKENSGPVVAHTEQIRVETTNDLNLESDSELLWTVKSVEVESEGESCTTLHYYTYTTAFLKLLGGV